MKRADTLSRKNCPEITPMVYTYTRNSHTQTPPTVKIKINWCNDNWPNEEKKNSTRDSNQGPLDSRRDPYNCTTMYMVSGHHSNTFSSISPNQRRQSKICSVKCLVLIHSVCRKKIMSFKPPVNYSLYFFFCLVCNEWANTLSRGKKLSGNQPITWSPTMQAGTLHSSLGKGHHVNKCMWPRPLR